MRFIALEEHFVTADLLKVMKAVPAPYADRSIENYSTGSTLQRLEDVMDWRLCDMEACGVDVQVLSLLPPGLQIVAEDAVGSLASEVNDMIAEFVRRRPDRFEGMATLATARPDEAAAELERAVQGLGLSGLMLNGRTRDRNLDDPAFEPIFATAERLRCPVYIHPQIPSPTVCAAYYDGFDDKLSTTFATGGIGWHYETGVQALRLILSGVLDRFPSLQIVLGHWGEVVLFYLERVASLEHVAKLDRPLLDYFRQNVSVTPSGIFSPRYLRWAIEMLGADRIMFSTDYPFQMAPDGAARRFITESGLSAADQAMIASGNWERLKAQQAG